MTYPASDCSTNSRAMLTVSCKVEGLDEDDVSMSSPFKVSPWNLVLQFRDPMYERSYFHHVRATDPRCVAAYKTLSVSTTTCKSLKLAPSFPSIGVDPTTPSVQFKRVWFYHSLNVLGCEHQQETDDPSVFDEEARFFS
ncbi:hypothetical protein Tco_0397551 [Tanacetum coccineum]